MSMNKTAIINVPGAPGTIGPYSPAIAVDNLVFLSGQIPLDPDSMELVPGGIEEQTNQVFANLTASCNAAGGDLNDLVKITIYILDFKDFPKVNELAASYLREPYPARATIAVAGLPKNAMVEIEGIMLRPD